MPKLIHKFKNPGGALFQGEPYDVLSKLEGKVDLAIVIPTPDPFASTTEAISFRMNWVRGVSKAVKEGGSIWVLADDHNVEYDSGMLVLNSFHRNAWVTSLTDNKKKVCCKKNQLQTNFLHLTHWVKDSKAIVNHQINVPFTWNRKALSPIQLSTVWPYQPLERLTETIIRLCTKKNELVVFPFMMDSESLIVSAQKLKRRFVGMDPSKQILDRCNKALKKGTTK